MSIRKPKFTFSLLKNGNIVKYYLQNKNSNNIDESSNNFNNVEQSFIYTDGLKGGYYYTSFTGDNVDVYKTNITNFYSTIDITIT